MPQKPNKDELYDEDIERYLNEVSTSIAPPEGSLQQRMYAPKQEMWETMYDPIHVWLRAGDKQDFQNSLERYYSYAQHHSRMSSSKGPKQGKGELWPPWKLPAECDPHFKDPRLLLHSKY